jgi:hypothetical protein
MKILRSPDLTPSERLVAGVLGEPDPAKNYCKKQIGEITIEWFMVNLLKSFFGEKAQVILMRCGFNGEPMSARIVARELSVNVGLVNNLEGRICNILHNSELFLPYFLSFLTEMPAKDIREYTKASFEEKFRRLSLQRRPIWNEKLGARGAIQQTNKQLLWIFRRTNNANTVYYRMIKEAGITPDDLKILSLKDLKDRVIGPLFSCLKEMRKVAKKS